MYIMTNLSSAINVGLVRILSLAKHSRSHHLVAVRSPNQGSGAVEYGGAIMKRRLAPSFLRLEGTLDGLFDQLWRRVGVLGESLLVVKGTLLDLIGFSRNLQAVSWITL
jgi:hypothetical protein